MQLFTSTRDTMESSRRHHWTRDENIYMSR